MKMRSMPIERPPILIQGLYLILTVLVSSLSSTDSSELSSVSNLNHRRSYSTQSSEYKLDVGIWTPLIGELNSTRYQVGLIGKTVTLTVPFIGSNGNQETPKVEWFFEPPVRKDRQKENFHVPQLLNIDTPFSRYSTWVNKTTCPQLVPHSCFLAHLNISRALKADEGVYTGRDASLTNFQPSSVRLHLQIEKQIPSFGEDGRRINASGSIFEDGHNIVSEMEDDFSVPFFYAPPFMLDFNMNSSACLGQNFTFHCQVEPSNYGINLVLYSIHPHPTSEPQSEEEAAIDNNRLQSSKSTILANSNIGPQVNNYEHTNSIHHTIAVTQSNQTGGYLCVASVPGMSFARWSYMHLQVIDCQGLYEVGLPINSRALELLLSPAALVSMTICIIFLACLGAYFFVHNANIRRRLLSNSSGSISSTASSSCKWKLGPFGVKVVRQANVLYPAWTHTNNNATSTSRCKQPSPIAYSLGSGYRHSGACKATTTNSSNTPDWNVIPSLLSSVEENREEERQSSSTLLRWQDKRCLANRHSVDSVLSPPNRCNSSVLSNVSSTSYMMLQSGRTRPMSAYLPSTPVVPSYRNLQVPTVIIHVDDLKAVDQSARNYRLPIDPKWEVSHSSVQLGRQIGAGAFGVVYAGTVRNALQVLPGLRRHRNHAGGHLAQNTSHSTDDEVTVAVKTLRDNFTEQELADLVREMEILKQFNPHPHIIPLLGVCTQQGRLQVLVEYAPYGNLRDFLIARRPSDKQKNLQIPLPQISLNQLLHFGLQVALGMDYLTRLHVVHRDLAARNVLIGVGFVAKIADFGLTRATYDYYRKCSNGRLPIKWMAPESIFDRRYTTKSDVWSFGILLWEIFSYGGTPYPTLSADSLMKALHMGYRNSRPPTASLPVFAVMLSCWSTKPENRPSFASLSASLRQIASDQQQDEELELTTSSSSSSTSSSTSSGPDSSTVYMTLNVGDHMSQTELDYISSSNQRLACSTAAPQPFASSPQPNMLVNSCYATRMELG